MCLESVCSVLESFRLAGVDVEWCLESAEWCLESALVKTCSGCMLDTVARNSSVSFRLLSLEGGELSPGFLVVLNILAGVDWSSELKMWNN